MTRFLLAPALLLSAALPALAQDMPLSQILIDGEGWKKAEGKPEKPKRAAVKSRDSVEFAFGEGRGLWAADSKGVFTAIPLEQMFKSHQISCFALSPDHSALFIAGESDDSPVCAYVWAIQFGRKQNGDLTLTSAAYCSLRIKRGKKGIEVTSLAVDKDGRIYAATELGVQVFDPTGRLCGVMTAPDGKADLMAFEGDKLTIWVGNTKYARKLNTTGVKQIAPPR